MLGGGDREDVALSYVAYCLNSRSEENFIRNTSILGAWNTAYSMEYVEYGWNTAEYRPLGGHLEYVENVFRQ